MVDIARFGLSRSHRLPAAVKSTLSPNTQPCKVVALSWGEMVAVEGVGACQVEVVSQSAGLLGQLDQTTEVRLGGAVIAPERGVIHYQPFTPRSGLV